MILRRVSPLLLACLIAAPLPVATGQEDMTQEELQAYEERLEADRIALEAIEAAQEAARADLAVVNRQLLAAAQEGARREEQASRIEQRLISLEIEERQARDALMADREGLRDLIAALIAASRRQPPALATHPDSATDAIRSAIIMRDLADDLEDRSATLAASIREYADLLDAVRRQQERLDAEEEVLAENQREIEQLVALKRAAFEDLTGEADALRERVAALATRAENIRSFLDDLAANAPPTPGRKPPEPTPSRPAAPAPSTAPPANVAVLDGLGLPATGQLVQAFGDLLPTGRRAEGITLRTRSAAQVVAPSDATIEYAGPFRSYGQMLILRTGDGYHIVLYGLSDVYPTLGQSVLAGEPIGRMTNRSDVEPDLHMELRRNGTPEDPQRWMSRRSG